MVAMSSLTPWTAATSSPLTTSPPSSRSNFPKHLPFPSSSPPCLIFRCQSQNLTQDHQFVLHDALDASGFDTHHARAARDSFCSQISRLSSLERETSICIDRGVDLGTTALHIAAEDHNLVSQSSEAFPVDEFVDRLDDVSMGCLSRCSSSFRSSPEDFLGSLERYLYGYMGFRRATARNQSETQALYLDSVLTHRSGSVVMLSLIYSEILKMVRMWDLLNFDVEIYFPHDLVSLPRGYQKQKSKVADQSHIMTSQSLLAEVLRNLKEAFWPFKYDHTMSLFLRAAHAANCIGRPSILEQRSGGIEIASAKAIKHKAEYGVWNGDMRCALSACERLILLESGSNELRDYSVLLYHCGFYQESLHYLKLYQSLRNSCIQKQSSNASRNLEEDEVEKLMIRLNLILMEQGWTRSSCVA